jgi:large conductance mechanosensitive channel
MDLETTKLNLSGIPKRAWTLLDEFKAFAFKGNVVDLTIGVIIGGAFHTIIDSFVKNVLMPLIAALAPGKEGYKEWKFTIRGSEFLVGHFLADVIHFVLISALLFFFIVKFLGWMLKLQKEDKEAIPLLTKDQELLAEIRDLLKANASTAK